MIRSPQTAFVSALVLAGGLSLGWMFTRTSPAVSPERVPASFVRSTAADAFVSAVSPFSGATLSEVSSRQADVFPEVSPKRVTTRAASTAITGPRANATDTAVASPSPINQRTVIVAAAKAANTRPAASTVPGTGFAPLPLPALSVDAGAPAVVGVSLPAVLAVGHTRVALDSVQKADLEALADAFAEQAGEPPADGSDDARSAFAVNAYIAATEADFLIKQRYGHRAYIQMQMEAHRASFAR